MILSLIAQLIGNGQKLTGVKLREKITQKVKEVKCDGVFVAIGHSPNTSIFKDKINLDLNGYILTDNKTTHTSIPGVYACGDVQDSSYRQAITAAGTGCMAAIDAERFLQEHD